MDSDKQVSAGPDGARWLRKCIAGAVAALSVRVDDGFRATSVSAFMVASIEPPQMLVSLDRHGQMLDWIENSGAFALSVVTRRDQFLADRFAGFAPLVSHTWTDIPHILAATGSPILEHALAWADCTVAGVFDTGDHRCVLGDIVALGSGDGDTEEALVYYLGRYRGLRDTPL